MLSKNVEAFNFYNEKPSIPPPLFFLSFFVYDKVEGINILFMFANPKRFSWRSVGYKRSALINSNELYIAVQYSISPSVRVLFLFWNFTIFLFCFLFFYYFPLSLCIHVFTCMLLYVGILALD